MSIFQKTSNLTLDKLEKKIHWRKYYIYFSSFQFHLLLVSCFKSSSSYNWPYQSFIPLSWEKAKQMYAWTWKKNLRIIVLTQHFFFHKYSLSFISNTLIFLFHFLKPASWFGCFISLVINWVTNCYHYINHFSLILVFGFVIYKLMPKSNLLVVWNCRSSIWIFMIQQLIIPSQKMSQS